MYFEGLNGFVVDVMDWDGYWCFVVLLQSPDNR